MAKQSNPSKVPTAIAEWLSPIEALAVEIGPRGPPRGAHERDRVLVGHVDTQHTPLVFRTPRWVKVYDRFTTAAFAGFLWQVVDFIPAAVFSWTWTWPAALPGSACAVVTGCEEVQHSAWLISTGVTARS